MVGPSIAPWASPRSGDLDPSTLLALLAEEGASAHSVEELLNRQSGLLGLSGLSQDMRTLQTQRESGSGRAAMAIDVFTIASATTSALTGRF